VKSHPWAMTFAIVLSSTSLCWAKSIPSDPGNARNAIDAAYFLARKDTNITQRFKLLSSVAIGYARSGDAEGAAEILAQLREANLGNSYILLSSDIAITLTNSGYTQKALAFVTELNDAAEKNSAIDGMVGALINIKDVTTAAQLAKGVSNTARKNRLLLEVAEGYAVNGNIPAAIEQANLITDASKNKALTTICGQMADAQLFQKAIDLAGTISDPALAQAALSKIAQAQAAVRQFEGASQTIKLLTLNTARQAALQALAVAYIQNNQFLDAKPISDGISTTEGRDAVLTAAAVEYAALRDTDRAASTLQQLSKSAKSTAAFAVATELVGDENFEKALEIITQLPPADQQIYIPRLATEFGKAKQYLFSQLLIKQINPEALRYLAAEKFITSLATHAQPAKPIQFAGEIVDPTIRDRVYCDLVSIYVSRNAIVAAGDAAQRIQNPALKVARYCTIAKVSKTSKELNDWINKANTEWAKLLTPQAQADGLINMADVFIATGTPKKAEDILLRTNVPLNKLVGTYAYVETVGPIIAAHERTKTSLEGLYLIRQMWPKSEQIKLLLAVQNTSIDDQELLNRRQSIFRDIARQ